MRPAEQIKGLINTCLQWIINVYMVLIIGVMPFYFTKGYGRIGTDKYRFFYGVTTRAGVIFLALLAVPAGIWITRWLRQAIGAGKCRREEKNEIFRFSWTDRFAAIYALSLICSYLHSDFKGIAASGTAWNGYVGWYMGFVTQMLFVAVYFAVSRYYKGGYGLPALFLPVTFAVFFLGYCNRFEFRPLPMEYANASFISTIGNINWYCAYVVVVLFGMLYVFWSGEVKHRLAAGVLWIVCGLGIATLVTQGSNSGHVTLAVMFSVFFLLSVQESAKMQRFAGMLAMAGGVLTLTMFLRLLFPENFLLQDKICDLLTVGIFPVLLTLTGVGFYILLRYWEKKGHYPKTVFVWIGKLLLGLCAVLAAVFLILIVCNTCYPGSIGVLSDQPLFRFDFGWGSRRGATYTAGFYCFMDQDLWGKLFGAGPDCMGMYIQNNNHKEWFQSVQKYFGGYQLTNAHCEWLTILVNMGLLGLIGFAGMIVSGIWRFVKAGKSSFFAAACGMGILAYTINNMFSFQQAMATGTMFLMLGMGEAYLRAEKCMARNTKEIGKSAGKMHGTKKPAGKKYDTNKTGKKKK